MDELARKIRSQGRDIKEDEAAKITRKTEGRGSQVEKVARGMKSPGG